jgi:hypothetical protein
VFTRKVRRSVHLGRVASFTPRAHCGNSLCKKTADENLDLGGSDPGVCAVLPPKRVHGVAPAQIAFCMRQVFRPRVGREKTKPRYLCIRARIFSLTDFPDFVPISINRGALRQVIPPTFPRIPLSHALYCQQR